MKLAVVFLFVAIFLYSSSAKSLSREDVSKELSTKQSSASDSNESRGEVQKANSEEKKVCGHKTSIKDHEEAPINNSREKRGVKSSSKSSSSESNSSESREKENIPEKTSEGVVKVEATTVEMVIEEVTI